MILALATAVHTFPEPGDGARLGAVAYKVQRLHVKYRILMAYACLAEMNLLNSEDTCKLNQILTKYEFGADRSLQVRIQQTKLIVDEILRHEGLI